jgi:hypothetical protein
MKYLIIASFFLSTLLYAEQNGEVIEALEYDKVQSKLVKKKTEEKTEQNKQKTTTVANITKKYKYDSTRQQMLRKAKYLQKKYEAALIKFENWEMKKELLKKTFREKNRKQETAFGVGNSYGKERADKRRREYYNSLDVQERHIQERVDTALMRLTDIKEEFLFQYAVPLTAAEMKGIGVPVIEDKSQKVEMLNEYINESSAWRKCREKVDEFDKVSRVAGSIEKLFPTANLTKTLIEKKMEQNKLDMQSHIDRYQGIEQEYQAKYGLAIMSGERAMAILENIKSH